MKLIIFKGLPGCGKTTEARIIAADNPSVVLVCKDDLRELLHMSRYSPENESQVVRIRDKIIIDALNHGRSVICHDTNLNSAHMKRFKQIAAEHNAELDVIDLTHVDIDICIKRDAARSKPVGEKVIRDMAKKWLS